ncbi:tyrosine-type recombinase/integrase [Mesoflavibacter sp. SCSIO 43206]|uniref:tyrosine-type recombinase/integrase n=1 Tax=Mesoflavibacter sp. SCSIO 43206 TaxID=2779362 RepID=UPI00351D487B
MFLLLQQVHDSVHDLRMKLKYSKPKIYTGGVDIHQWSKLSTKEKKEAISKQWYVYYSFRNPETGKLTRQSNIKGGANLFKDKRSRYSILEKLQRGLEILLEDGFNPYSSVSNIEDYINLKFNKEKNKESKTNTKHLESNSEVNLNIKPTLVKEENPLVLNLDDAFSLVLETKKSILNQNSFPKYRSRVNRFKKWLLENNFNSNDCITKITKKTLIVYLNSVLQSSSPRNRNNTRVDLSSFFQVLEDNDLIKENFVKKINVLRAVPERNKTYKPDQLIKIQRYLDKNDPILSLFVKFISYNVLRPIEVCRLKIEDLDLQDKKLYVRAKNKPVKIKIIPDILVSELSVLKNKKPDLLIFTPHEIGGVWDAQESNRRDYFTKRFKNVKDHFNLGSNYGLYSFRHTYITKMYRELAKQHAPNEAKSKLMLITGHSTMTALEQYLRDIDAVLPEDYSKLLM